MSRYIITETDRIVQDRDVPPAPPEVDFGESRRVSRIGPETVTKLLDLMYACRATVMDVHAAIGKPDAEWKAARKADEEARAAFTRFVLSLEGGEPS